ncbi:MAG: permease [Elusimicrobiota bacterium]
MNIYHKIPINLKTAILAGIFLPLCTCGIFPLVKSLMLNKNIKGYVILTFLLITPMLSPYTIFLSYSILGVEYLAARVICAILIAVVGGLIITSFSEFEEKRMLILNQQKSNICNPLYINKKINYIDYGLFFFRTMSKFVLIGIVIGSLLSTFLPPQFIDRYINNTLLGLFSTVFVAIPVNICSGQEVILLKPLQTLGLTMGHQIAFTIAATGICAGVLPLYYSLFGKKLTCIIVFYFFISAISSSFLINWIIKIFL